VWMLLWNRVLKTKLLSYYYYLLWWCWYECIMICLRDPPRGSCPLRLRNPRQPPQVSSNFLQKQPFCRYFFGFNRKNIQKTSPFSDWMTLRMGGDLGGRASSARSWILFYFKLTLIPLSLRKFLLIPPLSFPLLLAFLTLLAYYNT